MEHMNNLTENLQIASFIIASIASFGSVFTLYIAVKTFKRNKTIELENQLFRTKLEAYSNIIYEIERFFSHVRRIIHELTLVNDNERITKERLDQIYIEIENIIYDCDLLIVKYSAYFPESAIIILKEFSENLFGGQSKELMLEETSMIMNQYYDKQLILANDANKELRKDLKLDSLNKSLFNRL